MFTTPVVFFFCTSRYSQHQRWKMKGYLFLNERLCESLILSFVETKMVMSCHRVQELLNVLLKYISINFVCLFYRNNVTLKKHMVTSQHWNTFLIICLALMFSVFLLEYFRKWLILQHNPVNHNISFVTNRKCCLLCALPPKPIITQLHDEDVPFHGNDGCACVFVCVRICVCVWERERGGE